MYRVYHGILQSSKQIKSLQQQDTVHHCSLSTGKNKFPKPFRHGRKRLSSESTPVPFVVSNSNTISRCEQIKLDYTQQTTVTNFFVENDPVVQECDVVDDSGVCVVITNVEVVNETTELNKTDHDTNPD